MDGWIDGWMKSNDAEIKRLREELQTKEHQLQSLQQEALAMQKMLHEEVEHLQKEWKAEKEEASWQRRHVYALEKELKVWCIYGIKIPVATINCNWIFHYSPVYEYVLY